MAQDNGFFSSVSNAVGALGKGIQKEWDRATKELGDEIVEDINTISADVERGGFLGGVMTAVDVLSPGHQAVNVLDAFNVIPEDKVLQEVLSGGINLGVGLAVGGGNPLTLAGTLLALKDGADAIGAMKASPAAIAQAPTQSQTPMSPEEAKRQAIDEAKDKAKERARQKNAESAARNGYSSGVLGSFELNLNNIIGNLGDLLGPSEPTGNDEIDEEERKMLAEIKRILNTPGMMFEDMIYALMRAVIRGTDKQAKALTRQLESDSDNLTRDKKGLRAEVAKANDELAQAKKSNDPVKIAEAENKLMAAQGKLDDIVAERTDSRNERFEQLKQMLQKLSEMQQALSNILNSQHESAMAAIRNIR